MTLIERYGPDKSMVELRLDLAASCPKIEANKIMDLCGVYLSGLWYGWPALLLGQ